MSKESNDSNNIKEKHKTYSSSRVLDVYWRLDRIERGLKRIGLSECEECNEFKPVISIGKDGLCQDCLKKINDNPPTENLFPSEKQLHRP